MATPGRKNATTATESPAGVAPPPLPWQVAVVEAIRVESVRMKSVRLRLARPTPYLPGQHFVVRVRAPDGYTAQRSYSAASAPDGDAVLEIAVERLPDGEVSTFLHDELRCGDRLELRGPIGGHFAWDGGLPALCVGGGSGLVPFVAMLRLARARLVEDRIRVVASVRTPEDLPFAPELAGGAVRVLFTRRAPPLERRLPGRLRAADLEDLVAAVRVAYVAGSAAFADVATGLLIDLGMAAHDVRVERFGPTG